MKYVRVDWDSDFDNYPHENDAERSRRTGASTSTIIYQRKKRGLSSLYKRRVRSLKSRTQVWPRRWGEAYSRDNGTCQVCGSHVDTCDAEVHHVVHRQHWKKLNQPGSVHDLDNLITLCKECHQGTGGVHDQYRRLRRTGTQFGVETFRAAVQVTKNSHRGTAVAAADGDDNVAAWMYNSGASVRRIACRIGVSTPTVLRKLHSMGVRVRGKNENSMPPRRDVVRPTWLTDDILANWSIRAICERAECSRGPVQRWRHESGVRGQRGGPRDRCKRHEMLV